LTKPRFPLRKQKSNPGDPHWLDDLFLGKARLANSKHELQNSLKEMMKQQPTRTVQSAVKVKISLESAFYAEKEFVGLQILS